MTNGKEDLPEIQGLVMRLHELVPRDEAVVELTMRGSGPDESQIAATQRGYLRFGVELMQAAFVPMSDPKHPNAIDIDLDYLFTDDTEIQFDTFERVEAFPTPEVRTTLKEQVIQLVGIIVVIGLLISIVVGIGTIIRWATG